MPIESRQYFLNIISKYVFILKDLKCPDIILNFLEILSPKLNEAVFDKPRVRTCFQLLTEDEPENDFQLFSTYRGYHFSGQNFAYGPVYAGNK